MKKFARKNQWIITALAVLIAVAGYLNFTGQEIDKNGWKSVMSLSGKETAAPQENADAVRENADAAAQEEMTGQKKESKKTSADTTLDISAQEDGGDYTVADSGELKSASEENPGEAVMVSNSLGADYFSSAKLSREQSRAKNKETLMTIINNDKIASKDKKSAIDQVAQLTKDAQLESAAELMLEAKGFTDSVVSIEKGSADRERRRTDTAAVGADHRYCYAQDENIRGQYCDHTGSSEMKS